MSGFPSHAKALTTCAGFARQGRSCSTETRVPSSEQIECRSQNASDRSFGHVAIDRRDSVVGVLRQGDAETAAPDARMLIVDRETFSARCVDRQPVFDLKAGNMADHRNRSSLCSNSTWIGSDGTPNTPSWLSHQLRRLRLHGLRETLLSRAGPAYNHGHIPCAQSEGGGRKPSRHCGNRGRAPDHQSPQGRGR